MKGGEGYRRLFAFDFDGTLSPIVPVRTEARMHPASRRLLRDLAHDSPHLVAVLSSRSLADLASRVFLKRVYLGGGSGLEWRLPGGQCIQPEREAAEHLEKTRSLLRPALEEISAVPGVDIEDKRWSIAVHYRRASPDARTGLDRILSGIRRREEVRIFNGPSVAEIMLVPGWEKARGLESLCRFLRFDPSGGRIVYAGDDENDGGAMRWVLSRKGTALAVGIRPRVPGARVVTGPLSLARAVRALACLPTGEG